MNLLLPILVEQLADTISCLCFLKPGLELTMKNITAGFKVTGVCPLNKDLQMIFDRKSEVETRDKTSQLCTI